MKHLILAFAFLPLAAQASTPTCREAIDSYDRSGSEVEYNELRPRALRACRAEVKQNRKAARLAVELERACNALDEPTDSGDAGPHTADSCKVDAYRFVLNFLN